jgi:hypothetical protein
LLLARTDVTTATSVVTADVNVPTRPDTVTAIDSIHLPPAIDELLLEHRLESELQVVDCAAEPRRRNREDAEDKAPEAAGGEPAPAPRMVMDMEEVAATLVTIAADAVM